MGRRQVPAPRPSLLPLCRCAWAWRGWNGAGPVPAAGGAVVAEPGRESGDQSLGLVRLGGHLGHG